MRTTSFRHRLAVAGVAGASALVATLGVGVGTASAAPADPAGGATPVAPSFNNGNVEAIRGAGSDTTFFMMQKIGDLYTAAGLYGCTLNTGSGQTLYNALNPASSSANANDYCQQGQNVDTTDTADNWNRTEVYQGVDAVGSGAGQNMVCGQLNSPLTVDFARSSKPAGTCSNGGGNSMVGLGYAKDGVAAIDFTLNPSAFGTAASTSPYAAVNGGNIGPVASGWLPGDPVDGSANNGTAFGNLNSTDGGGGAGSTAYRLWCATDTTKITDWGQLTNLGPNLEVVDVTTTSGSTTATVTGSFPSAVAAGEAISGPGIASGTTVSSVSGGTLVLSAAATASSTTATLTVVIPSKLTVGSGAPIGVPVRIMGMNPASGTMATMAAFSESGVSGGGCASNTNTNAAVDPNPATAPTPNAPHISLENNGSQVGTFAAADFPGDAASQAVEVATTLDYESNGVYNSNTHAGQVSINGTVFAASKLSMNNVFAKAPTELSNQLPTARTLWNIYNPNTVKASTAGFMNWICDSQSGIQKQVDLNTGLNYDAEVSNIIGSFGFSRLTDTSPVPAIATPTDGLSAPNTTCATGLNAAGTLGNGVPAIQSVANPQH